MGGGAGLPERRRSRECVLWESPGTCGGDLRGDIAGMGWGPGFQGSPPARPLRTLHGAGGGDSAGGSAVPEGTPPFRGSGDTSVLQVPLRHAVPKAPQCHPHFCGLQTRTAPPIPIPAAALPPPCSCLFQFSSPRTAPQSLTINKWTWPEAWATIWTLRLPRPLLPAGPGTASRRRCQHPSPGIPERCQIAAVPVPAPGERAEAAAHKEGFIARPGT